MPVRLLRAALAAILCVAFSAGSSRADSTAAGLVEVGHAPSVEVEGAAFQQQRAVEDVDLQLHSTGVLRWLFFNGYAAALYLGDGAEPRSVLGDVAKRLELHYFRAVPASAIADAAQLILGRNIDALKLAAVQQRVDDIAKLYVDIQPGDRYALSYLPQVGTVLEYNDERLGVIPGEDFAAAYFAIWLGADPIDVALRDQLLKDL